MFRQTAGTVVMVLRMTSIGIGALLAGGLHTEPAQAGDDSPADAAQAVQAHRIALLVEQLGSRNFAVREIAETSLRELGESTREALRTARRHPSAEVRSRVTTLLRQLDIVPLAEAFETFADRPDERLDLEEGMWLISRIVDADADRQKMARELDSLAADVRKKLGAIEPRAAESHVLVEALCEVLFHDHQFRGNVLDYQSPANSSLEQVLKTRTGLPILLSHVAIAVGRRLQVPLRGVPTPGRYLFKYDGDGTAGDLYIDPFAGGKVLSRADREALFPGLDPDRMVDPQSARDDLARMLSNLETHLYGRDQIEAAELALRFRLALQNRPRTGK